MAHKFRTQKKIGTACLFLTAVLLCSWLAGCSGEVYDPSGEQLTLGTGETDTAASTGGLLEIPDGDPFADSEQVLRVDFLNTGDSDAILLRVHGAVSDRVEDQVSDRVVLVDTGESDDYSLISSRLAEYGVTEIHHLILTHFDNDHIGSAVQILQNFPVGAVYMPDYVRDSVLYRRLIDMLGLLPGTEVHRVTEEMEIELPGGQLRLDPTELYEGGIVLGSDAGHGPEENNFSLIASMRFGEIDLLLPGDAEQDRLVEFMEGLDGAISYDLIKIPHHGDYDKALGDLLRGSAGLRYCVVHAGAASRVEAALVTAIRSAGAAAYFTYSGTVRFSTDGVNMVVEQE